MGTHFDFYEGYMKTIIDVGKLPHLESNLNYSSAHFQV